LTDEIGGMVREYTTESSPGGTDFTRDEFSQFLSRLEVLLSRKHEEGKINLDPNVFKDMFKIPDRIDVYEQ
jgi:hypothetical protein